LCLPCAAASGGTTITYSSGWEVHTFRTSGTLMVTAASVTGIALVVGGGGGGGAGGGSGASR
jgi:hypothetical protein